MASLFEKIVIVGAGELGRAVGKLLIDKRITPVFWDADPAKVPGQSPLKTLAAEADCVLLCIPSWSVRTALAEIVPALKPNAVIVCFSKGIDEKTLKTMGELLPELLATPFAVIGGPMLAQEIMLGKPAAGVIASSQPETAAALKELLESQYFKLETSADPFSVSLAGVLKNIYAVAMGIADGLGFDGNQKGLVAGRAMAEMMAVGKSLGASADVIAGTAGFADFLATAYSPYSRNREIGEEIVRDGKCNLKGEGLASLPFIEKRLKQVFPLMHLIHEITIDCKPADPLFTNFFSAPPAPYR